MNKNKYKFNTKSLTYEKVTVSFTNRLFQILSYLATGIVFATLTVVFAFKYIDSPKDKRLKRELAELTLQYDFLNDRMEDVEKVLSDIEERDNNIYRTIFEAERIPSAVRRSGFGGVNRYEFLDGYDNTALMVAASQRLDLLSKQLYSQSKSFDEVAKLVKNKEKLLASMPAIQPVANKDLKRMASGYGFRIHPIYKKRIFHEGMDFTAKIGTAIYATGDGVVVRADAAAGGYGIHVVINHGFGYKTLYGHMLKYSVRPGQRVKRGEIIGYVGNTGRSTGPHVHYEIIKDGRKINPINYYYNDLSPKQYKELIEQSSQSSQSFD
jgi:murein DD-endopeptidase MepM/ murein hydrolase activator NlpD